MEIKEKNTQNEVEIEDIKQTKKTEVKNKKKIVKNKYTVNVPLLNVRTGPGLKYDKLSFADFTEEIQSKILKRRGEPEDAVVEGTEIDVTEIKENWGKTNMGWICLDYCKKTGA